jgi:hypothetical protein
MTGPADVLASAGAGELFTSPEPPPAVPAGEADQPVFVTESQLRRRALRVAGIVLAVLAALWVVAVVFSVTGLGRLPGLQLPGVPSDTPKPAVSGSSPAPAAITSSPPPGTQPAPDRASRPVPGSNTSGPHSTRPATGGPPPTTPFDGSPLPASPALTPGPPATPASRRPTTPAAGTAPSHAQGTSKVTPGDTHSALRTGDRRSAASDAPGQAKQ